MTSRSLLLLLCLTLLRLPAEDIDLFTRDLDLSGLELPVRDVQPPAEENQNLFEAWDALPEAFRTLESASEDIHTLTLPGGPFLAVPNPVNLPNAYRLLDQALTQAKLKPLAPLVVLIHADNNVSVGSRVHMTESIPLPLGSDLSTMPERRLLVIPIETDTAHRTHPALVTAAARLQQHARAHNLTLQTRELYLLPLAPDTVLFGLLIGDQ